MKIEEAILYCLTSQNRGMRTEQIAEMINHTRTVFNVSLAKEIGVIMVESPTKI